MPKPDERGDQDADEDLDLPPIIGGSDDDGIEGDLSDLLDALDDGGDDPLDDREADIDPGVEIASSDDSDEDDDRETDVGPLDEGLYTGDRGAESDDEQGLSGDDGDDLFAGDSSDDGGAEGTGEPIEDAVDEALFPPLDEDEPHESHEDDIEPIPTEPRSLRWSAASWSAIEGAGAVLPCRTVAVGLRSSRAGEASAQSGAVVAAGEVLLVVEEGAHVARSAGHRAIAAAVLDGDVLAADAQGNLALIPRGATAATSAASWDGRSNDVEIAPAGGRAFVRVGGRLFGLDAPGSEAARPLRLLLPSGVRAIAPVDTGLLAIVGAEAPNLASYRGDDDGWSNVKLTSVARRLVERPEGLLSFAVSASGQAIAIADGSRLVVSRNGGALFEEVDLDGIVAVAFQGDEGDAPLLAIIHAREGLGLVEVPAGGDPACLADLSFMMPSGSPPPRAALAWDSARDVAWIASPSGLFAVGPARRH